MRQVFATTSAFAITSVLVPLAASVGQAVPFTAGNLVVVQVGDGSAPLTSAAAPVFLREVRPSDGSTVQLIPMPTAVSPSGRRFVLTGTITTEGLLRRSVDDRFLTLGGYDAAVGTASVHQTAANTVNRVIARVSSAGAIDTTTAFNAFTSNSIRAAVTTDGTQVWASGLSSVSGAGGIYYIPFGGTAATHITAEVGNARAVGIQGGTLFVASGGTGTTGVFSIGAGGGGGGLPTTPQQPATLLPGMPGVSGPVYVDFVFADALTMYLTDERDTALGGGVQKWVYTGTAWVSPYTLNTNLPLGARGLAARVDQGVVTLYATTADTASSGTRLWRVVDTGGAAAFTLVATAPAHAPWRDVEFAPAGGSPPPPPPTCYANCDQSTAAPVLNVADFTCFLQRFAAGATYANCDNSTSAPVLNVADFTCFLQRFAAGCP